MGREANENEEKGDNTALLDDDTYFFVLSLALVMAIYKKSSKNKQRYFSNDLKALLYAFGDSAAPNAETIQTLEDVLTSYLIDVLMEANKVRQIQKRTKLKVDDIEFALRKDAVKLGRVYDLQEMDKQITMAKKMFDEEAEKPERDEGKRKKRKRAAEESS
ncbi:hypothetical protein FOA43_002469 [Brettanomyces nanus]|uniref:Transcription initiation factor TFIID subunit 13 n=1 Tax=Eeniella nana TaxID=13502 RepID=A0A875S166_EENNA|nr:uncharacterized protein FOA43_002469 [Brettanomyces nanus]QPG75126.1 hypothetical protein FOA43_002469 [Brettanomyces nanus]